MNDADANLPVIMVMAGRAIGEVYLKTLIQRLFIGGIPFRNVDHVATGTPSLETIAKEWRPFIRSEKDVPMNTGCPDLVHHSIDLGPPGISRLLLAQNRREC